jgi:hypothetical protein
MEANMSEELRNYLEECERKALERLKELDYIQELSNRRFNYSSRMEKELDILRHKLDITIQAIEYYATWNNWHDDGTINGSAVEAQTALAEINRIENPDGERGEK